jgi:hypothetical protein
MLTLGRSAAAAALALTAPGLVAEECFSNRFDGKTTAGWIQRGGKAVYTVEDGAIVGRTVPNTLSDLERSQGFELLWDGRTTRGWRSARDKAFPKEGWEIRDGELTVIESGGGEARAAGDIITERKFAAFDLRLEFRLAPGANSGVKYYVDPELNQGPGSSIGLEFQLLDDERHPDAKAGRNGNRTLGSLYDLIPAPAGKKLNPIGEWNEARVVSRGRRVEHWLNGVKLLEYERGTPEFRRLVAESKYKVWPGFGGLPAGHILLQDHGNRVSFRNVKLRELKPE